MISLLQAIVWDVSPELFTLGPLKIRWYGLLFATGFFVGQKLMMKFYAQEGKDPEQVDVLTLYMVFSTVVGARLGHCLFYQPDFYLSNPIEILKIWEGGLASHGATIGILSALYFYSRRFPDQSYLWVLDRLVVTIALAGSFIRFGNFVNSEIVGVPTDLPWGVIFARNGEDFARHPAQLYESMFYFITFIILYFIYQKQKAKTPRGQIFGLFLIMVFGFRFIIEFVKKEQVDFEVGMALNMGQMLSIPLILIGGGFLYWSSKQGKKAVQ